MADQTSNRRLIWLVLLYGITAAAALIAYSATDLGLVAAILIGFLFSASVTTLLFTLQQRSRTRH